MRETEILVEQQPPQAVLFCDHAGLVINNFSKPHCRDRSVGPELDFDQERRDGFVEGEDEENGSLLNEDVSSTAVRATPLHRESGHVSQSQKSGVPQERGCPFPGDGGVRTSVSFLQERVV